MAMDIFTLDETKILHETKADFRKRTVQQTIHLVQYDKSMPVIAVDLMNNGYSYTLPSSAEVWVRWGKKDRTYVYKKCMRSEDYKKVYFEFDYQMSVYAGESNPILELIIGAKSAGSSSIPIVIDRNPIQDGDIESRVEDSTVAELRGEDLRLRQEIISVDNRKQDKLTFDTTPRMGSNNPVTSEGIKVAIADSQAHGIYNYKGQVPSYSNLPTSGRAIGDVWEAIDTGINWAWNGSSWDNKGTGFKAQLNLVLTPQGYKHATDNDDGRELEVEKALQANNAGHADSTESIDTSVGINEHSLVTFGTNGGDADIQSGQQDLKSLGGATIIKNNYIDDLWPSYSYASTYVNGLLTITSVNSSYTASGFRIFNIKRNHIYLIDFDYKITGSQSNMSFSFGINNGSAQETWSLTPNINFTHRSKFINPTIDSHPQNYNYFVIYAPHSNGAEGVITQMKNIKYIDLTQMFGDNNVVNAILGTGTDEEKYKNLINFFGGWLPIEYDTGTPLPAKPAKLKTVDYNKFNKVTEIDNKCLSDTGGDYSASGISHSDYIEVQPETEYYATDILGGGSSIVNICFYDKNKNFIEYESYGTSGKYTGIFKTPANCWFIRVNLYTADKDNVCIFQYWDGSRIGYEPYSDHEYDLPNIELNGILKVDGDGNIYADGDIVYPEGQNGKKRYFVYTITGDEGYTIQAAQGGSGQYIQIMLEGFKAENMGEYWGSKITNGLLSGYIANSVSGVRYYAQDKTFECNPYDDTHSVLYLVDASCSTIADYKAKLIGKKLIIKLNEEQDLESASYPGNIHMDDFGTFEFLDENGNRQPGLQPHHIFYRANIAGFAESLYLKSEGNVDNLAEQQEVDDILTGKKEVGKSKLSNNFDSKLVINDISAWNFRTTAGGEEVGDPAKVKSIIGGTIFWNQITKPYGATQTRYGMTLTCDETNQKWTIQGTSDWTTGDPNFYSVSVAFIPERLHKYLFMTNSDKWQLYVYGNGSGVIGARAFIYTPDQTGSAGVTLRPIDNIYIQSGTVVNETIRGCIFDLTIMFGSTIADYIYSLEQAIPGSGIAWFKKYFPKEYYGYSTPAPMHVKISGIRMNRFNQFDESTKDNNSGLTYADGVVFNDSKSVASDFIRAIPGMSYYTNYRTAIYCYDANKNYLGVLSTSNTLIKDSNANFDYLHTVPAIPNIYYLRFWFRTSLNDNIDLTKENLNVNYHWDGERDGEYEEFFSELYPVDDVELKGIPMLDSEGNLYFDGDKYWSDGTVDENFNLYTFEVGKSINKNTGSLDDWLYYFSIDNDATNNMEVFCNRLATVSYAPGGTDGGKCSISKSYQIIYVNLYGLIEENNTDAVRIWLENNNVQFIYRKKTSTQSQATPFTEIQARDNWGSEEIIDAHEGDVEMPVSVDTDYLPDLKAKLESAPGNPENDGDYVMHRENGENSYSSLASWLSDNGYVKPEDLSSGITDRANLTYMFKKVIRLGKTIFLSIECQNKTGATISSGTSLFTLPSGAYNTWYGQRVLCFFNNDLQRATLETDGNVSVQRDLGNNDLLTFNIIFIKPQSD